MHVCTIAARNYLAHARVLVGSFLEHHPDATATVLLVDGQPDDRLTDSDRFEVLRPDEIGLDRASLRDMRMIYDVTELSTALKPSLLKHLLARTSETVIYLDPDCVVYGRLNRIDELAAQHSIVLTPHVTSPIPRDGLLADEQMILWSGIFNLGFIAVTAAARPFLDWWQVRTRFDAIKDPQAAMFTDQRWVDFVPALFSHHVMRDRGYNVAYWNLFERPVERSGPDRTLTAGGAPLRFYHFSGYDPDEPHALSRHQADRPRALLSDHRVVAELCADYSTSLRRAGFDGVKHLPYRFGTIAGGPVDSIVRTLVRTTLLDPAEAGSKPPDPFSPDGEGAFVEWLNEPVIRFGGGSVSRLVLGVWRQRADLQAAMPDVLGEDASRLARWAGHDPDFRQMFGHLERSVTGPRRETRRAQPAPGLNIVGYFDAELGVGEAGRLMVQTAERAGVPLATHVCRRTLSRQDAGFQRPDSIGPTYDISLFCVNADSTPQVVAHFDASLHSDLYRVGLWFWEVDQFPRPWRGAFDHVDEVWVASDFTRDAIAAHTKKPVHVFPVPIVEDPPTYLSRSDLRVPEGYLFLFCFDAFSVPGRKNPGAVVEAFKRAFPVEGEASLVIKSINGASLGVEREQLRVVVGERTDITIIDDYWPRNQMAAVMQLCDCYVSLHRSEGFGLTMAAAMTHAKPVIATGYSGNLAFMNGTNSLLVPYDLVSVGPGHDPYPAGAHWADPDVDAAADLMRQVRDRPGWAAELGERGRDSVERTHGLERSANELLEQFDRMVAATLSARLAS